MKKTTRKHGNSWYDGTHYTEKQPFATFLTCRGKIMQSSLAILTKKIHTLIPNPSQSTALEIGPGTSPVLPFFPFRESYFIEQSEKITQALALQNKKRKTKTKSHFIVGDILKLPFSKPTRFDLTVMNEVLTHVQPGKRVQAIKKIADISNALLLVERPQVSYSAFRKQMYPEMFGERTTQEWKDLHATYTRIPSLRSALTSKGFVVRIQKVKVGETYCILSAQRKSVLLSTQRVHK